MNSSAEPANASAVHSIALTKAHHVRNAAAQLYNRCYKKWHEDPTAAQARALTGLLSLTLKSIETADLVPRIQALEKRAAALKSGGGGNPPTGGNGGPGGELAAGYVDDEQEEDEDSAGAEDHTSGAPDRQKSSGAKAAVKVSATRDCSASSVGVPTAEKDRPRPRGGASSPSAVPRFACGSSARKACARKPGTRHRISAVSKNILRGGGPRDGHSVLRRRLSQQIDKYRILCPLR